MPYRLRSIPIELHQIDYLANTPYNLFIDFVLKQGDLTFKVIYITLIFIPMTLGFYLQIPPIYVQNHLNLPGLVSFLGYQPVMLNLNNRRVFAHFNVIPILPPTRPPAKAALDKKGKCIAYTMKVAV